MDAPTSICFAGGCCMRRRRSLTGVYPLEHGMLEPLAQDFCVLVVHAPRLFQEADKALEARRDGLVSMRVQIALHIRKPRVEQSTRGIVLHQGGLGKSPHPSHMPFHRL